MSFSFTTFLTLSHMIFFSFFTSRLKRMITQQTTQFKLYTKDYLSSKKQESSRKTSISALLAMPKRLTVWITINYGKFFKRREYQTT